MLGWFLERKPPFKQTRARAGESWTKFAIGFGVQKGSRTSNDFA
jgi:hypothetical protein